MMQFKAHKVNVTSERHLAEEAHNHSIAAKRRAENLCKMEWYYHDNLLKLLKRVLRIHGTIGKIVKGHKPQDKVPSCTRRPVAKVSQASTNCALQGTWECC